MGGAPKLQLTCPCACPPSPHPRHPRQVFKLDIDDSPVELEIMAQVEEDPKLFGMISELMFEMHVSGRAPCACVRA